MIPRGVLHDGRRARRGPARLLGVVKGQPKGRQQPAGGAQGRLALAGPPHVRRRARDAPVARERDARARRPRGRRARPLLRGRRRALDQPHRAQRQGRRARDAAHEAAVREELDDVLRRRFVRVERARAERRRRRRAPLAADEGEVNPLLRGHFIFKGLAVDGHARGLVRRVRPAVAKGRAAVLEAQLRARARPREDDGREPRRAAVRRVVVVLVGVVVRRLGRVVEPVAAQDELRGPGRRHVAGVHLDARLAARQLQREARPVMFAVGRAQRLHARREVHEGLADARVDRRVLGLAQAPAPRQILQAPPRQPPREL